MSKSKSADYIDASVNVNKEQTEKRHYLKSLLELNGFNLQDEELYETTNNAEIAFAFREAGEISGS